MNKFLDNIPLFIKAIIIIDVIVIIIAFFQSEKVWTLMFIWFCGPIIWCFVCYLKENLRRDLCYNRWVRGVFILYTVAAVLLFFYMAGNYEHRQLIPVCLSMYVLMYIMDTDWRYALREKEIREEMQEEIDHYRYEAQHYKEEWECSQMED